MPKHPPIIGEQKPPEQPQGPQINFQVTQDGAGVFLFPLGPGLLLQQVIAPDAMLQICKHYAEARKQIADLQRVAAHALATKQ